MSAQTQVDYENKNGRKQTPREVQYEIVAEYEAENGPIPEWLLEEIRSAWVE